MITLDEKLSDISLKELYKFRSIIDIIINHRLKTERLVEENN